MKGLRIIWTERHSADIFDMKDFEKAIDRAYDKEPETTRLYRTIERVSEIEYIPRKSIR